MADLFEPTINPCRCGNEPAIRETMSGGWKIECGDSKHYYGLTCTDRHDAIRAWNTSLASKER